MISKLVVAGVVAVLLLGPSAPAAYAACGDNVVDVGEQCDGGVCCSPSCTFVPAGAECRPRAVTCGGVCPCDAVEVCTGLSATCPADSLEPVGTACRPRAETCGGGTCLCDAIEVCDGLSRSCPADGLEPAGTTCRPVAKDFLNCPNPNPPSNCPDTPCDVAEVCTGSNPSCPTDAFASSSTLCRAAEGVCDLDDYCTGSHVFCLPNLKSTAVCRPSAGSCDPAENCDGFGNDCPADVLTPIGTVCRAAAGVCDIAESCAGDPTCPADDYRPAGTECRAAAGVCDVAESCSGAATTCPVDDFVTAGTECRAALDPTCDVAESCTGSGPQCPADAFSPNGTSCDDGLSCTVQDMCVAAQCVGNSMTCGDGVVQTGCSEECDDGNTTSGDGCSSTCLAEAGVGCPFTPLAGCRQPFVAGKSSIQIIDREKIGGLKFRWRWKKGTATTPAELGDPLTSTSYLMCVYDQDQLLTGASAPAGGTCGVTNPRPCWQRRGASGFQYKDVWQSILPSGIKKLQLRAGRDGRAEVQLLATGGIFEFPSNGGLGLPNLAAIQQPLRVQVQSSAGLCFETVFSAPAGRQTPNQFDDKAD